MTYQGSATAAITTTAVRGRISQAERIARRQPPSINTNKPSAANGSTMPTGPLASTAKPRQPYISAA